MSLPKDLVFFVIAKFDSLKMVLLGNCFLGLCSLFISFCFAFFVIGDFGKCAFFLLLVIVLVLMDLVVGSSCEGGRRGLMVG